MPRAGEESQHPQRKLTTILAADVVGYSRMMGADEDGTHRLLGKCRKIIDRSIVHHGGRIFNTGGDSVMAEFSSAVEAVRCALEIQEEIVAHNTDKGEPEKMWFRIGLNVGDVIIEGDDLIGDGVNIAARMESIAEPGGICISGSVYELVRNKLSFAFEDMGEQAVKNIAEPIPAYGLLPVATPKIASGRTDELLPRSDKKRFPGVMIGIAAVAGMGVIAAALYFSGQEAGTGPVTQQVQSSPSVPVAEPVLHRPSPSYFAEKVAEGVNRKTGERFVIEMTELGSAVATFYNKDEPTVPRTTDSGRWWINQQDRICFEFKKIHQSQKFCLIHEVEGESEWLVSGDPSKPKWTLHPR